MAEKLEVMIRETVAARRTNARIGRQIEAAAAAIRERALRDARQLVTGVYEPLAKL